MVNVTCSRAASDVIEVVSTSMIEVECYLYLQGSVTSVEVSFSGERAGLYFYEASSSREGYYIVKASDSYFVFKRLSPAAAVFFVSKTEPDVYFYSSDLAKEKMNLTQVIDGVYVVDTILTSGVIAEINGKLTTIFPTGYCGNTAESMGTRSICQPELSAANSNVYADAKKSAATLISAPKDATIKVATTVFDFF